MISMTMKILFHRIVVATRQQQRMTRNIPAMVTQMDKSLIAMELQTEQRKKAQWQNLSKSLW